MKKAIFFVISLLMWGFATSLQAQSESAVRMAESISETEVFSETNAHQLEQKKENVPAQVVTSVLQKDFVKVSSVVPKNSSQKFVKRIKHNLKPSKPNSPKKAQGNNFVGNLVGIIGLLCMVVFMLGSEVVWGWAIAGGVLLLIARIMLGDETSLLFIVCCTIALIALIWGIIVLSAPLIYAALLMLICAAFLIPR